MCSGHCSAGDRLVTRFSFLQKLYFRGAFFGFIGIGFWGIHKQDPGWAYLYALICLGGVWVLNWALCRHCPYPETYQSCVFQPYWVVTTFFPYQGPTMSRVKKIAFPAAIAIMMAIPLYWLSGDVPVLVLFLLFCLALPAGFAGYLCRRCRHADCPGNRLPRAEKDVLLKSFSENKRS